MKHPELVEREVRGHVVVLRMRHGKVNALDLDLCEALSHAFDEVRQSEARGVVLTGDGIAFSAGVDLKRLLSAGGAYVERFHPALCSMLEKVFLFPRPVVAALNGHALAGGCLLAGACDFRYLARGPGRMGVTELSVGLPFPAVGIEIMRMVVPARLLRTVLFHGRTFTGGDALQHGFADEIVDPAELLTYAVDEAERLGEHGDVFAVTKDQLRARARQFLSAHGQRLDQHGLQIWRRPSTMDAVRRYVEMTLTK
jgi:enoyl-CoA hydratase/carnithine racemase